uniref:Annexin A7-like n=1 Tax=Crassostrea virginica TaxID=6565 RepID=A0A8B8B0R4_CRAVI|nr:annexin A7-like [Crassostrea virginica]
MACKINQFYICAGLISCWLGIVLSDKYSNDFDSDFEDSYTVVRNTTNSIATIIGIIGGIVFLVVVIAIIAVCCCCMRRRRSAGHVYRQPANQMIVTTATQQPYPNQYPAQQPYTQYPPAQAQYPHQGYVQQPPPPQGYVQHPPPPQGGYPPVQQAPPMTGSGYPYQENKASPSAPPADDAYPPYPADPQAPPPYPGH